MKRHRAALLIVGCLASSTEARAESVCRDARPHVVVEVDAHRLWLCNGATTVKVYDVSLGFSGSGKTQEGDRKTPTGRYALDPPRSSEKYGMFIPVGYPTPSQRAKGYSGGAVGIHGPRRWLKWLGRGNNWLDTTAGCIAVASDAEIEEIAKWVRQTKASLIDLRETAAP